MEASFITTGFSGASGNENTSVGPENPDDGGDWLVVFDRIQLATAAIGTLLNALTLVTLIRAPSVSTLMALLMRHQAFLDMMVCGMGVIILCQPYMWTVGQGTLDLLVCQTWHSQALYWGVFFLAGWNLVLLAVERLLAVCRPFVHANLSRRKVLLWLIPVYIASVVCNLPAYFEARYSNGTCESEYYFSGDEVENFYYFYSIFYFVSFYFLPCILVFALYGKVIMQLRQRQGEGDRLGQSKVIDRAASQLTKSAVVVTVIFVVTIGPDSSLYLLGSLGFAEYEYNSPLQKIMVFFTLLNSCANPMVYLCLLPSYRHDAIKLFTCGRIPAPQKNPLSNSVSNGLGTSKSQQSVATVESYK